MQKMPSLSDFLASEAGAPLRVHFREQSFQKGMLLPREGSDQIFVVRRGKLRVYLATEERELSLAYLTEGDVFSTHTRAELRAEQPSQLLLAPRTIIERQLAAFPPLQAAVIRVLAMTLAQSMTLIEDLAFHQVRGRIARYILRCAKRQKVELTAGAQIRLELGMEEVAALLGTTRQTASTEFNAMVHEGAIARAEKRRLAILLPEKLAIWASEGEAKRG